MGKVALKVFETFRPSVTYFDLRITLKYNLTRSSFQLKTLERKKITAKNIIVTILTIAALPKAMTWL